MAEPITLKLTMDISVDRLPLGLGEGLTIFTSRDHSVILFYDEAGLIVDVGFKGERRHRYSMDLEGRAVLR